MKKFLPFVSVVLAALAIVMFFLPFVNYHVSTTLLGATVKGDAVISGFQNAFSAENIKYTIGSGSSKFSGETSTKLVAVDLVAFILLCVALIAGGINLGIKTNYAKFIACGVILCLVAAAVLMFLSVAGFYSANEITGDAQKAYGLGIGAILGGVLAILGAGAEGYLLVAKK